MSCETGDGLLLGVPDSLDTQGSMWNTLCFPEQNVSALHRCQGPASALPSALLMRAVNSSMSVLAVLICKQGLLPSTAMTLQVLHISFIGLDETNALSAS